jgi:hypothetical protein
MLDSVNKVERYRKEANRCAGLAKKASPPFLAEIYRRHQRACVGRQAACCTARKLLLVRIEDRKNDRKDQNVLRIVHRAFRAERWVRGITPLSVPSSGRAGGAGCAPQALCRRGPSGCGAARRDTRPDPGLDERGDGTLRSAHHASSIVCRKTCRAARPNRCASRLSKRGIVPTRRRRSCNQDTAYNGTCSRRIARHRIFRRR